MRVGRFIKVVVCAFVVVLVLVRSAVAQESVPAAAMIDHGDNAWMLVSSALVLLMTAPGLALFYGGLVRKKNVLGVMMQCVFLMALNTVIWSLYGYSLAFGGDPKSADFNPWIGNGEFVAMRNVQPNSPSDYPMEGAIPRL